MIGASWLLRWIPGTRAYAHRQVDRLLAIHAKQVRALMWCPVDAATRQRVLEAILAGRSIVESVPDGEGVTAALPTEREHALIHPGACSMDEKQRAALGVLLLRLLAHPELRHTITALSQATGLARQRVCDLINLWMDARWFNAEEAVEEDPHSARYWLSPIGVTRARALVTELHGVNPLFDELVKVAGLSVLATMVVRLHTTDDDPDVEAVPLPPTEPVSEITWEQYQRDLYHQYVGTADVLAGITRDLWKETRPDWQGRYWRLTLGINGTTLEPINVTEDER